MAWWLSSSANETLNGVHSLTFGRSVYCFACVSLWIRAGNQKEPSIKQWYLIFLLISIRNILNTIPHFCSTYEIFRNSTIAPATWLHSSTSPHQCEPPGEHRAAYRVTWFCVQVPRENPAGVRCIGFVWAWHHRLWRRAADLCAIWTCRTVRS